MNIIGLFVIEWFKSECEYNWMINNQHIKKKDMLSEKSPDEHNSNYMIEVTVQVSWEWVMCISLDLIISQKVHNNLNMGSWHNYFMNYKSVTRLLKSWVRVLKEGQTSNDSPLHLPAGWCWEVCLQSASQRCPLDHAARTGPEHEVFAPGCSF